MFGPNTRKWLGLAPKTDPDAAAREAAKERHPAYQNRIHNKVKYPRPRLVVDQTAAENHDGKGDDA